MFEKIAKFGKKHNLQSNCLVKGLMPVYHGIQRLTTSRVKAVPGNASAFNTAQQDSFLADNPERIGRVAGMLADDKSRETYLGIVKFRQTGFKKDFPLSYWEKKQYFVSELGLGKDEVFVDCGAFTGDTIDAFVKHCGGYKAIIAFEPDLNNIQKLKKKYGDNPKITLIDAGVYDRDGEISFDMHKSGVSKIANGSCADAEEGGSGVERLSIQVRSIDSLSPPEKITFIKMDVEGAELSALRGAEKTIRRDKPKLAICIYHSNEDMVRIAEYIRELVPEYKLYVRQHNKFPSCAETVLYAVMQ
jgi:FkbM family methyltransferase